ncbi:restriction endonuclease subunit S [Prevotella sp.]|uniref:restriction endonuclease subunit S n=1 Tax=Prevotella sp. TaxID=59823 RepID=UPI0025FB7495|nr:restriction endonuclease subunit S [Prevotella sp.]
MRLKDITIFSPQYVGDNIDGDVSFVPMESLRNGTIDYKTIPLLKAKGKYTYFGNQDLLIAKVTPCFENGNIAIARNLLNGIGFGSSEIFVLRPNKEVISQYLFYLSQSRDFQDKACATMCGVGGLKRISPLFMRTYEFDMPSIENQQRMVTYLDTKLSNIDHQVSLLTSKRDAYLRLKKSIINHAVTRGLNPNVKMKDSGIEWIGEVPEHWRRMRLKDIAYLYSGLTGKSGDDFRCDNTNITKPYVPFTSILNNFKINSTDFPRVIMSDNETQNQVIVNDLLFLMSSEDYDSIAKSAVVNENLGEVYLNSFCRGLRFTSKDIFANFVNYQIQATNYRDALRFEARGFTRINIKIEKISSMFVCLPPLPEQRAIATYLDDKCAKIDTIVSNLDKQISRYTDLKRSLIDEVITGKRAV